jgi:hypothetical protein
LIYCGNEVGHSIEIVEALFGGLFTLPRLAIRRITCTLLSTLGGCSAKN